MCKKIKCSVCNKDESEYRIAWLGHPVNPVCPSCWNIIKKNKKLENKRLIDYGNTTK